MPSKKSAWVIRYQAYLSMVVSLSVGHDEEGGHRW
jgi:hypothetical protein